MPFDKGVVGEDVCVTWRDRALYTKRGVAEFKHSAHKEIDYFRIVRHFCLPHMKFEICIYLFCHERPECCGSI